jgi:hypothetical protein
MGKGESESNGAFDMKRDMNLIRLLLLLMETQEDKRSVFYAEQIEPNYAQELINYHQYLLYNAGLAEGNATYCDGNLVPICYLNHLTWAGHDFLDAAREPERWEKAQGIFRKMGGVTLEVAKSVLVSLMTQQASGLLGAGKS